MTVHTDMQAYYAQRAASYEEIYAKPERQADLTIAYNNAANRATTAAAPTNLGGVTLVSGVYTASTLNLTGSVLTLDGENNPGAVFIFQAGTTLITGSRSSL